MKKPTLDKRQACLMRRKEFLDKRIRERTAAARARGVAIGNDVHRDVEEREALIVGIGAIAFVNGNYLGTVTALREAGGL